LHKNFLQLLTLKPLVAGLSNVSADGFSGKHHFNFYLHTRIVNGAESEKRGKQIDPIILKFLRWQ